MAATRVVAIVWAGVASVVAGSVVAAQNSLPAGPPPYASEALRTLVTRAAARSRLPSRMDAWLEQESVAFRVRDDGRVVPQLIQQRQGRLRWDGTEVTLVGADARGETYELDPAAEAALQAGWVTPFAGGERFQLRQPLPRPPGMLERLVASSIGTLATDLDTVPVIHPLASDREQAYRYVGGDTVPLVLDDGSAVTAVRVQVVPVARPPQGALVFTGELWVEAVSHHVRRLVGRIDRVRTDAGRARALLSGDVEALAYLDLQTIVRDDHAVPSRVTLEERSRALAQEATAVVRRVATAWYDSVAATSSAVLPGAPPFRLVVEPPAPARPWRFAVGEASQPTSGSDARFMPWWPERERATGPAIGRIEVRRESDLYRYNRIEGLFTGTGVTVRLRDRLPGAVLRMVGGWAWQERTWRARASFTRTVAGTSMFVGAGRFLDLTNDFRSPYDSGSTWGALLLSQDPYDYVERRYARLGIESAVPEADAVVRLEAGIVDDRAVTRTATRGLLGSDFFPNRAVDPGLYGRGIALVEWQRNADVDPTRRRIGLTGRLEVADGDLSYQRLEARLVTRTRVGAGTLAAVLHGGAVFGRPPAQQLFELGGQLHLPGYAFKEFAGDRAATLDLVSTAPLGILDAPIGEIAGVVIPALAPAVQVGLGTGWTSLSTPEAREAAARLGPVFDPTTGRPLLDATGRPRTPGATGDMRVTISAGLQFFGGALFVGAGRALDGGVDAPKVWRAVLAFGRLL